MSWEVYNPSVHESPQENKPVAAPSPWQVVQQHQAPESYGRSLGLAPGRLFEDIGGGLMDFWHNIPQYYEKAKTEIPGLFKTAAEHPGHLLRQGAAGSQELVNQLAQLPLGLSQYGTNRLHLVPQSVTNAIANITPENTSEAINQIFGKPQYPGEELFRGTVRNLVPINVGAKVASLVNPMRYTAKGISKNVVNELNKQVETHSKLYDKLWAEAKKKDFDKVHFDPNIINPSLQTVKQFYSPKQYKSFEEFVNHPSLQNAQKAQSDLGALKRSLEERARTQPLMGGEKDILDSLTNAEKHIEGSMFKNAAGHVNEGLAKKYNRLSRSYKENVVPYKYNPAIQAYLNKELTAKELVNALSRGEFAAKKGSKHPAFAVRNALTPSVGKLGWLGAGALGTNYLLGREPEAPIIDQNNY